MLSLPIVPGEILVHYLTRPGERLVVESDAGVSELEWAGDGWWVGPRPDGRYRYTVTGPTTTREAGALRPPAATTQVDRWRSFDPAARSRTSALFSKALATHHPTAAATEGSTTFRVLEPWVPPGHAIAVVGSDDALGAWDPGRAVLLQPSPYPWWEAGVDLVDPTADTEYKYLVVGADAPATWEPGPNRVLPAIDGPCTVTDNEVRGLEPWRGFGVAVPVFSLRGEHSLGVGQFTDLVPFVDWAASVGCSVVQILPVNDTTKDHDWADSYPYDPISVHALHPLYLDVSEVATPELAPLLADAMARLEPEPEVEYEEVMAAKWELARRAFDARIDRDAEAVAAFSAAEWEWLGPYAAWCVLRDAHGTADHAAWGPDAVYDPARVGALADPSAIAHREMAFHCWLQYHLHRQLDAAVAHARSLGVAIKGDLPIGVSPTSVETWVYPELFRHGTQTGAPPDAFAVRGQNWGFPTYVWEAMADDDYRWWRDRFTAMARSVDVYRIDHVLGFFRIWEVPPGEIDGLLGRFRPCLPIDGVAFAAELGLDLADLTSPWIDRSVLEDRLGPHAAEAETTLFVPAGGRLAFRSGLETQSAVDEAVRGTPLDAVRRELLDLRGEVLLLEVDGGHHPRISWGDTEAYRRMDGDRRSRFDAMATDFFFHRHEAFWGEQGHRTLTALLDATDLLACGEDLGLVPTVVPEVMADLGVLSLEIERMPKALGSWLAEPARAPYASVVSPGTHDMAPVRLWWMEDPATAQRYWSEALGNDGPAPATAGPDLVTDVVERQLASPAMLAIVPIQDLLAMDDGLARPDPHERINEPADRHHRWRYRLHLSVDDLAAATTFNRRLSDMVRAAGR